MARIIENFSKRRTIRLSTEDVISIVREYQAIVGTRRDGASIKDALSNRVIYLPEEI